MNVSGLRCKAYLQYDDSDWQKVDDTEMIRVTTTHDSWGGVDIRISDGVRRCFVIDYARPDEPAFARQYPYTALCVKWDAKKREGVYMTPPYRGTLVLEAI